jgi:hypothetical protein
MNILVINYTYKHVLSFVLNIIEYSNYLLSLMRKLIS